MRDYPSRILDQIIACGGLVALAILVNAGCQADPGTPDPKPSSTTGGAMPEPPKSYPASDPCTVLPQAGCPADHTCLIATEGGATVCQSAGTAPLAGACAGNSECAPGLVCVGATCQSFCEQPSDCEGTAPACIQITVGSKPVKGWSVCSIPCNPADPQNTAGAKGILACPAGLTCFSLDPSVGQKGSTGCYPAGAAPSGAACASGNDCGPGLVCLTDAGASACRPMCVMGQSQCTCSSFAEPFYAAIAGAIVEVGYCQ